MERVRDILRSATSHRAFLPVLIGAVALTIGLLLAFEHSRNLLKVRGPYLIVLSALIVFPIFAFRFFDPHEDGRPISIYFVSAALYFILLGSPDLVTFLRMLLIERLPPGSIKQVLLGLLAFAGIAGCVHYVLKITRPAQEGTGQFLAVSAVKFLVYAVLHTIYLNLFVAIAREKFGITTVFG